MRRVDSVIDTANARGWDVEVFNEMLPDKLTNDDGIRARARPEPTSHPTPIDPMPGRHVDKFETAGDPIGDDLPNTRMGVDQINRFFA